MICTRCAREIPDDARLCCYCGRVYERKAPRRTRGNGEGSARPRGTGWQVRVILGWVERPGKRPKPIEKTKAGFRTKAEALAYAKTLKAQAEPPKIAPTLAHYWEIYSHGELERLSDSKRTAYGIAWKRLKPIATMRVDRITVQHMRDTVSVCATYYPARDCKQLLKNLYKLAAADGWVNGSLPDYILLPERNERERQPFTIDEQRAIWASYEAGNADAALPLVMIYTGMMPGELQQLRPEMIDWKARRIVGAGLKTKVRRESPIWIPDGLVPVLRDLVDASTSESGYILPRNESAFYARYYAALERAGVRRLEPYSCRHTTATALAIDNGVAPQTIQRIMRWSTTRMLDRYAHPDDATAQATVSGIIPGAHEKNAAR